ncbi:TIGR03943 family putative permease subunit [Actinokineospora fastidiosa]|uniref:TIGR03943 family protein n=1 Tax=Actinokineospora fastidiosa TaxID=1816 RepID=A0A918GK72_9PSEU|nr:TIGR03943 family protein [Actinokineospora fastidiosa]GGS41365.1 TIGR03943 family protein [Actinokineospora fastidiosa]
MRRETQNILLILAGGALLKISFTGAYLQYVKPAHLPWLVGGGLVMVALAVISIGRDLIGPRPERAETPDGTHERIDTPVDQADAAVTADPSHAGHDHGADHEGEHNHSARSAWLLLLPVLAIFLIAPPALGADSVMRTDNSAAASRASGTDGRSLFPPLPQGEVISVAMSDFAARAAWDSGDSLKDRTVRLTGFIVAQEDAVYLARLSIACCAADAFPVKVKLDGEGTSALENDMWVEAVGQVQMGTATKETDYVPTLTVTGLSQIPQPENPYEA